MLIDSHSHIYLEDFDDDLDEVIQRSKNAGVGKIILPNIDTGTIKRLLAVSKMYHGICYPLIGLHPTSVDAGYKKKLGEMEAWLEKEGFYGIGEVGIDLYWDKSCQKEQEDAFMYQLRIAKNKNLPVVIHVRNSFAEVYNILEKEQDGRLKGIFHCFTGNVSEAKKIIGLGFKLGVGGVVTFKNSNLREVLQQIDVCHLVLETDSPYLAPVPFRGKRNESAYLKLVADKVAEVYSLPPGEIARVTSGNVKSLFCL
ncbi:Uncharacterized metal-dependent hydrolase YcfH [hydrothermal vent metagenome]|uniref:Uncharacterized metal-dependent hydrolase YcfH n=1 Tax=hydrothermal vent metagenome TaxID=652676 RepID=A0A3B0T8I1_9ZZZZ